MKNKVLCLGQLQYLDHVFIFVPISGSAIKFVFYEEGLMHSISPQAHRPAEDYSVLQHGAVELNKLLSLTSGNFLRTVAVNFH